MIPLYYFLPSVYFINSSYCRHSCYIQISLVVLQNYNIVDAVQLKVGLVSDTLTYHDHHNSIQYFNRKYIIYM